MIRATVGSLCFLALFIGVLVMVRPIQALSTGIPFQAGSNGQTCTGCHNMGGVAPTVTIIGPTTVQAGQTASYTIQIQSNAAAQTAAGIGATVRDGTNSPTGTLTPANTETQILAPGELTHTAPKSADGSGLTTFEFSWTAPTTVGSVTMYVAGNSVNEDSGTAGDNSQAITRTITVQSPMSVSLKQVTFAPKNTPPIMLVSVLMLGVLTGVVVHDKK